MLQHRENKKEYDGSESNLVYTRVVEELEMEHIKKQAKTDCLAAKEIEFKRTPEWRSLRRA